MDVDRVTLVTVESRDKAEVFQHLLGKYGIHVHLAPNEKIKVLGEVSPAKQPTDVMVARADVEESLNIIQTKKTQEMPASEKQLDITVVHCRHCDERILVKKSMAATLARCPLCAETL